MKKDYTKFSETSKETENEMVTLTVNQDFHFNETIDDSVIKDTMEEPEVIEKGNAKLMGVVSGFTRLNVREKPSRDSKVLCVLDKNEEVEINTEEDTTYEDFYAIITTGPIKVKGYCVKDYIEIK